jgi:hypothetical protein
MNEQILNSNEQTFMEGAGAYLKSSFNVIQGTFFLTSTRFVFCKRSGVFNAIAGPLLMHLAKGSQVVFEINLSELKSIHSEKHGFGSKLIFTDSSNQEYALQFILNKEKWLNSIQDAVKNSNSRIKITQIGDRYSFLTEAGDAKSKDKTSDEALTELKKVKDKFDLELITKEEYEVKKAELRKFIN